jgi:hypothetical protein
LDSPGFDKPGFDESGLDCVADFCCGAPVMQETSETQLTSAKA